MAAGPGALTLAGAGNVDYTLTADTTLSLSGPVTGNSNNLLLTGTTGITLTSTVDGVSDLTMTASAGPISSSGVLGGTTSLGSVTASALNAITCSAAISTRGIDATGNAGDGGPISLTSSAGNVSVSGLTTSGGNSTVSGLGGDAGSITLQPAAGLTAGSAGLLDLRPDGLVILNGNLTAAGGTATNPANYGSSGAVSLALTGRTDVPSVATIVSSIAGNDVTITCSAFTAGTNEIITILGAFDLNAPAQAIFGDISCTGDLTVVSSNIICRLQSSAYALTNQGTLVEAPAMALASGGAISFSSTPTTTGTGALPNVFSVNGAGSIPFPQFTITSLTDTDLLYFDTALGRNVVLTSYLDPIPPFDPGGNATLNNVYSQTLSILCPHLDVYEWISSLFLGVKTFFPYDPSWVSALRAAEERDRRSRSLSSIPSVLPASYIRMHTQTSYESAKSAERSLSLSSIPAVLPDESAPRP